jgi:hypothetical protein
MPKKARLDPVAPPEPIALVEPVTASSRVQEEIDWRNSLPAVPALTWRRCPLCDPNKPGKVGICTEGDSGCFQHGGSGLVVRAISSKPYLYRRLTPEVSRPVHGLLMFEWVREGYGEANARTFLKHRHIHHLNRNGMDNRLENLLPLLPGVHMSWGHHAPANPLALWELDGLVAEWSLRHGLLEAVWRPLTLPCLSTELTNG